MSRLPPPSISAVTPCCLLDLTSPGFRPVGVIPTSTKQRTWLLRTWFDIPISIFVRANSVRRPWTSYSWTTSHLLVYLSPRSIHWDWRKQGSNKSCDALASVQDHGISPLQAKDHKNKIWPPFQGRNLLYPQKGWWPIPSLLWYRQLQPDGWRLQLMHIKQ